MGAHELSALRIIDKPAWVKKVTQALKTADGHIPDAAEKLDVSVSTMYRWLADPAFANAPRAPWGVCKDYSHAGRPPKKKD